jgi:hypothetical protein
MSKTFLRAHHHQLVIHIIILPLETCRILFSPHCWDRNRHTRQDFSSITFLIQDTHPSEMFYSAVMCTFFICLFLPCHLWDLSALGLLALPCFQELPSLLVLQTCQVFQVHPLDQDYLASQGMTRSQFPKSIPVFNINFINIFIFLII